MKEWAPLEVEFYKRAFAAAGKGNYDIYVVFVEKGLSLLNGRGRLGFILPHKFFNAQYGEALRGLLAEGKHLAGVVHFGDAQIFAGATTYTCLLFLEKAGADACRFTKVDDLDAWQKTGQGTEGAIPAANVTAAEWNFTVGRGADLFEKLRRMPVKLGDVASIFVGLQTSADKIYILEEISPTENGLTQVRDCNGAEWELEADLLKPFLSHVTVSSYEQPRTHHRLIFPYALDSGKAQLIDKGIMAARYPKIWAYLQQNSGFLRDREGGKWHHDQWYAFGRTQNMTEMDAPKLIVQVISQEGRYAYDEDSIYFTGGGNGPYYGIRWRPSDKPVSLFYLQGLLNAKLLDYYLGKISSPFRGGYWSYGKRFIEQLPIRPIDLADPADRERHDRMVDLVEEMLALHRRLAVARTDHEQANLKRQIDATDRRIDRLVYDLYNLTEEDIRIIEKG